MKPWSSCTRCSSGSAALRFAGIMRGSTSSIFGRSLGASRSHRSHSPITKSSEPRIETTSETIAPDADLRQDREVAERGGADLQPPGDAAALADDVEAEGPLGIFGLEIHLARRGICGPSVTSMKFWISSSIEVRILSFGGAKICFASSAYQVPAGNFATACRMIRTDWRISSPRTR